MAQVINSQAVDPDVPSPRWSDRLTLTQRILAVNILALALLAGSFFYLDSYRMRLIDERVMQSANEARLIAASLETMTLDEQRMFIGRIGKETRSRIRLSGGDNMVLADSWQISGQSFQLVDPETISWRKWMAGWLDQGIEFAVDAGPVPAFRGFQSPTDWQAEAAGWSLATDRTHMLWATGQARTGQQLKLRIDRNARDIRRLVRAERSRLAYIIGLVTLFSVGLSLFLARTIALPLRALADAAARVRLGRQREVIIPRLPTRSDEIGLLARAFSDMNHTLQQRIDATEAFAADVAHELKNPLASLSSAVESLAVVKERGPRKQLLAIIGDDVRRLDRLITDVADISRLDAQLARTRFDRVDIGQLIEALIKIREERSRISPVKIAFARPQTGSAIVMGDADALGRVIENLIDNALSFSPQNGVVRISTSRVEQSVVIVVEDDGPGVPESQREAIFGRFHTDRPDHEVFGQHSGLGLSIARAIVEGMDGHIEVRTPHLGKNGAQFVVTIPAAQL